MNADILDRQQQRFRHWWHTLPEAGQAPVSVIDSSRLMCEALGHLATAARLMAEAAECEQSAANRAAELWDGGAANKAICQFWCGMPFELRGAQRYSETECDE